MQLDKISRISLFIVFFYFGILKVLGVSQAEALVTALHAKTLAGVISIESFVFLLGVLECSIGILFLIPKLTKYTMIIFGIQMFTTFGPLLFLPDITWHSFLVPTIVGQYIIKNIVLIALALEIYSRYKTNLKTKK